MNNWKTRLKEVRKERKLTMEQLAKKIGGITKSAVSLWENENKKNTPSAENLTRLCEVLGINAKWLFYGKGEKNNISNANIIVNSQEDDSINVFEEDINLISLKMIGLSKNGTLIEIDNMKTQYKISKSVLECANVDVNDAIVATVNGNSMQPVMPHGTLVIINTKMKNIVDGEVYAIDHNGMLRITRLYKTALGIRIKLYNDTDYPDEEYKTTNELSKIKILGRIFYYSAIKNI